MIKHIRVGNILDPENQADIIIGMNLEFKDVRGIGRPFIDRIRRTRAITLGSVVTFDYDGTRQLHMLVCHQIGKDGWASADAYVRYGLDYLWKFDPERKYSIVDIGTGRVGTRDGADQMLIHRAIADSHLETDLFVLDQRERISTEAVVRPGPQKPLWMGDVVQGRIPIQVAVARSVGEQTKSRRGRSRAYFLLVYGNSAPLCRGSSL